MPNFSVIDYLINPAAAIYKQDEQFSYGAAMQTRFEKKIQHFGRWVTKEFQIHQALTLYLLLFNQVFLAVTENS